MRILGIAVYNAPIAMVAEARWRSPRVRQSSCDRTNWRCNDNGRPCYPPLCYWCRNSVGTSRPTTCRPINPAGILSRGPSHGLRSPRQPPNPYLVGGRDLTRPQRQQGLGAVEGLDLALLVDAEDEGVRRQTAIPQSFALPARFINLCEKFPYSVDVLFGRERAEIRLTALQRPHACASRLDVVFRR